MTRPTDEATMLTPRQVGEQLGMSNDHVLDLIHAGQLRALNLSRTVRSRKPRFRVRPEDLARFLESRLTEPVSHRFAKRRQRRPSYVRHV